MGFVINEGLLKKHSKAIIEIMRDMRDDDSEQAIARMVSIIA